MDVVQVERLLRERRERRIAADDSDDETDAEPRRQVMPLDERRRDEADEEAAGDVDRERAERKDRSAATLDQPVEAVSGRGSERSAERDTEDDGHLGLL